MAAVVRCAHLATLDLDLDCEVGCPPAVSQGRWTVGAASDDVAKAVLDDLTSGISVGGALLRLADRQPETGPVFAADGDQFAALVEGGDVHECNPRGGVWAATTDPAAPSVEQEWSLLTEASVVVYDECGQTVVPLAAWRPLELLAPDELVAGMRRDVVMGLTSHPKWLPPKYFYDDRGSELFDEITRLPEYYPTNAERSLLNKHSADIALAADAECLLELGSGSSEKTRWLIDAMAELGLSSYVPVDVSSGALRSAAENLQGRDVAMLPVVADFERHLAELPHPGKRLIAFLGGTIGNLAPPQRSRFLTDLAATMSEGETFLVGVDLVKDPGRLVRAYDDSAGVTAEFNRNVLAVLNRELDADFDLAAFEHVALWDPVNEWIEMRLRATTAQQVKVPGVDLSVEFAAGEEMRTEISAKFRRERIEGELSAAGLDPIGWWTDGDYALVMGRRAHD
ncbi:MAG: L-histidine N(alpha)-methyltransferase [Marmoricola sp.]